MSSIRPKYNHARNLFLAKPTFATYYRIGVIASKRIPAHKTYAEVGHSLGITKQCAYTESVVALGKLLYLFVHYLGEAPEL